MEPIELSIVICSYKSPELLRLCLESVLRNVQGVEYEIIVSDGETQEDTAMMMREDFPDIRFVSSVSNVGFGGLVRQGVEASRGKYLFILNPDILITPRAVEELLDYLRRHPEIGMVGPQLLNFNEQFQQSYFRFYKPLTILYRRTFLKHFGFAKRHLRWFLMKDYEPAEPKEVDWVQGSAMLVSREAVEKVGLMDPRFFMYMEDVDWCRRFWEAGYKVVYYPYVRIYHYHMQGSAKGGFLRSLLFNRLTWYHIASAFRYFRKYRGKPLPEHS
jgi:N-acetylglucosaminyl-diphospho-decaprenol L-rhamnosyltransferase